MSRLHDYLNVKHRSQLRAEADRTDAIVEDMLAGREVPAEWEPLAAAVHELRSSIDRPAGPMPPELARRVANSDFTVTLEPKSNARTAIRKVSSLSLKTKVAAGLAVGFTGLTGVTAAGALPDAAQERVENVVESVTPIEFPERAEFGDEVSDDAQEGGVDGQDVSDEAKENGRGEQPEEAGDKDKRDEHQSPVDPDDAATDRPEVDTEPPVDRDEPRRPERGNPPDTVPDEKGSPNATR